MTAVLVGFLPIALAASLGWLTLRAIGGARFAGHRWYLFYPVGAGGYSLALLVASWIGLPIDLVSAATLGIGMMSILFVMGSLRAGHLRPAPPVSEAGKPVGGPRLVRALTYGPPILLALAASALSVGRAYSSWDAMAIWSVKGYGIAKEGSVLAGANWGSHGLTYPLNLPLQISLFSLLDRDWLPHSKLINPIYYLSLLVGLHTYLRNRISSAPAVAMALLIGTSPLMFDHATNGYANLPFSVYLVLGILSLIQSNEPTDQQLKVTGGLLLGLATWTRPEGTYFAIVGGATLWLAARAARMDDPCTRCWLLPALLIALPWQSFATVGGYRASGESSVLAALASWLRLEFNLPHLYRIARYSVWQALQPQYWGVAVPALLLVLLMSARRRRWEVGHEQILVLATACAVVLTTGAYYYVAGLEQNLEYLLSTSVERIFMPGMLLALVGLSTIPALPEKPLRGFGSDDLQAATASAARSGVG